tara:strand:- start:581 stop:862 length:282 start_codon:yes stop_codon:yes gene_type:complete
MVSLNEVWGMCICVNCHWVDRCEAYHAVERQHGVSHLNEKPDWKPVAPQIHISVLDEQNGNGTEVEWDVRACKSFLQDEGRWMKLCPGSEVPK